MSKPNLTRRVSDSLSLIFVILVGIIITVSSKYIRPVNKEFFCDDQSIQRPYKEHTITPAVLAVTTLVLPQLIIFIIENRKGWNPMKLEFWSNFFALSYSFFYGFALTYLFTQISKLSAGRLRPHFMAVCIPDVCYNRTEVLTDPLSKIVTSYDCLGTNVKQISQAHLSFFSGHSSLAAFSMVFLVLIIQDRWKSFDLISVKIIIQSLLLNYGMYIGYTRISDNWHHKEDVACGLLCGLLVALCIYYLIHRPRIDRIHNSTLSLVNKKKQEYVTTDESEPDMTITKRSLQNIA